MADRPRPSRRGETPRHYPPELKERAIRLVAETIAEQGGQRHGAVGKVAKQLGIGPESLRHWIDQAEIDAVALLAGRLLVILQPARDRGGVHLGLCETVPWMVVVKSAERLPSTIEQDEDVAAKAAYRHNGMAGSDYRAMRSL